eukprot:31198-Pelagococcus_subviridis.AAC.18
MLAIRAFFPRGDVLARRGLVWPNARFERARCGRARVPRTVRGRASRVCARGAGRGQSGGDFSASTPAYQTGNRVAASRALDQIGSIAAATRTTTVALRRDRGSERDARPVAPRAGSPR